jgi:hypothetical protein
VAGSLPAEVVTQVRNVADTKLAVTGESARRWMSIAQCFAGAAADPPPPGTRFRQSTPSGTPAARPEERR